MSLRMNAVFLGGGSSHKGFAPSDPSDCNEGQPEEEMYLTTFLWEEAKHVEVFRRMVDELGIMVICPFITATTTRKSFMNTCRKRWSV